ncbi:GNAT family N-acetyltransferase [Rhizobium daejeonense]
MFIRPYRPDDLDSVIDVFLRAIRETASKDYTPTQIDAWARADRDVWSIRRANRPTWVAEIGGVVAGFSDLEADGHIDMMFVHPEFGGRGVATALIEAVEAHARASGQTGLHSEVSITARPFFERMGFVVIERETVHRHGQSLDRFTMAKSLG